MLLPPYLRCMLGDTCFLVLSFQIEKLLLDLENMWGGNK